MNDTLVLALTTLFVLATLSWFMRPSQPQTFMSESTISN